MTTLHNDAIAEMESAIRSRPGQYELIGGGSEDSLRGHATDWIECGFTPASAQPWWDAGVFDAGTAESARELEILPSALAEDYPDPHRIHSSPVSWGYAISNGDATFAEWGEATAEPAAQIPDGTYYLYPEGGCWLIARFRGGQMVGLSEQSLQDTHDAAGDDWAGMGDLQDDTEDVAADIAAAVMAEASPGSLPENVVVRRLA